MKKNVKRIILPLIVILFIVFAVKLYAQNPPTGLSVSPSNFEIKIEPGQKIQKSVTLYNLTSKEVDIKVERRNFTAQGEEGNVSLTSADINYSLASWIKVTPERIKIPSNKSVEFKFDLEVPEGAEPGGHFGSIVFSSIPSDNLNETGATVTQEVGSLVLVRVPGDINELAELLSFDADKKFYFSGPVNFNARVKNDSNVHLRPGGTVAIQGTFGKRDIVEVDSRNVLPDAVRKVPATWNKKFLIGRYNADLLLYYGESNKALKSNVTFYAFPVKEAAIAVVIIAILYLFRRRIFKALRMIVVGK